MNGLRSNNQLNHPSRKAPLKCSHEQQIHLVVVKASSEINFTEFVFSRSALALAGVEGFANQLIPRGGRMMYVRSPKACYGRRNSKSNTKEMRIGAVCLAYCGLGAVHAEDWESGAPRQRFYD